MARSGTILAVLSLLAVSTAYGGLTSAGLTENQFVNWTQLGGDGTDIPASFSALSSGGLTVDGSLEGSTSLTSVVCPASPSCSWVASGTGFSAGDTLIWTSTDGSTSTGDGPLTLTFNALFGVGAWVEGDTTSTYTAKIQAFNGATSLGSFTFASDSSGDPVFVEAVDTSKVITSVMISLTSCSGCDVTDFAVDTLEMDTTGAPEPSSTALFLAGLSFLAWMILRLRAHQTRSL